MENESCLIPVYCQAPAPSNQHKGKICGREIGRIDRKMELIALIRRTEDLERIFPTLPAIRCLTCKFWNVYRLPDGKS
jgi:hypothetical protein